MYHLPLLPGYGPNANIRSSVPAPVTRGGSYLTALSEAEEDGYQGSYFTQPTRRSSVEMRDGYISSTSPIDTRKLHPSTLPSVNVVPPDASTPTSDFNVEAPDASSAVLVSETEGGTDGEIDISSSTRRIREDPVITSPAAKPHEDDVVEVVFFEYGVAVFFGLTETQEKDILEDIENAGIMKRKINEDDWEIEECHFTVCR